MFKKILFLGVIVISLAQSKLCYSRNISAEPYVSNVQGVYPPGQTAAKTGDSVSVTAQVEPIVVDAVWCNATAIGGLANEPMWDDGDHNDGVASDGIYGTNPIWVDTVGTAYHIVQVTATLGANSETCQGEVGVDNHSPSVELVGTIYPVEQTAAKKNDQVRIEAWITDVGGIIDELFVMDISGSMAGNPLDSAKLAAKKLVDGLDSLDRASLFSFETNVHYNYWPPDTNHQAVKDSIDVLVAGGWTNLYQAICEAADSIQRFSEDIPVVVVLSDGDNTEAHCPPYCRDSCYFQGVPIFTIGYGVISAACSTFLDSTATTSAGGRFYMAPSGAALDSVADDIKNVIANMDAPKGIDYAWVDARPLGADSIIPMYDDGAHDDGLPGDEQWASALITVDTNITQVETLTVYARDVAFNPGQDSGETELDNILPIMDTLMVTYPGGKHVVSNGEKVFFWVWVADTGSINGVTKVLLDATQIGGPPEVPMRDDGLGNDAVLGDSIWTSDSIEVEVGDYSGTAAVYSFAYDIAKNKRTSAGGVVIDNIPPTISDLEVIYPPGQTALKIGDTVTIKVLVLDDISGVDSVFLDGQYMDGNIHPMVDDGSDGDETPFDNVYTTQIGITKDTTATVDFLIAAVDSQGNDSTLIGQAKLDNTAPAALVITVLDPDNIYRDGETIHLEVGSDAPGYKVRVNFAPIDTNYLPGSEVVVDNLDNTYDVTYTISETNTKPDSVYTIWGEAEDEAGNISQGSVVLRLDNLGPSTNVIDFKLDPLNDDILNAPDTLVAVIQDSLNNIKDAEYFIDAIGNYGEGTHMFPEDGAFDELIEGVFVPFSIATLSQGEHYVFVHGQDQSGEWGPTRAHPFIVDTCGPLIQNIQVAYPSGQDAAMDGQDVAITAFITDATTNVADTVRLDGTNLNGNDTTAMFDDGTNGDEVPNDDIYTALVTISTGLNGLQPFTIRARDTVPNQTISDTAWVRLDNVPPGSLTVIVEDPDNIYQNGETVHLLASTDTSGYKVTADFLPIDNGYVQGAEDVEDNLDGTYRITYTITVSNTRPDSQYIIWVTAKDSVGLYASGSVALVLDNSGPRTKNIRFVLDPRNDSILNAPDTIRATITDSNGVIAAEYFIDMVGEYGTGVQLNGATGEDSVEVFSYFPLSAKGFRGQGLGVSAPRLRRGSSGSRLARLVPPWRDTPKGSGELSEGQHTLYIRGKDSTQIWGTCGSMDFIKDTEPPKIEALKVKYPSGQEAAMDGQTVTITALITDVTTRVDPDSVWLDGTNLNGDSSVPMFDDGTHGDEVVNDHVYTSTITIGTGLEGSQEFTVYAYDIVPNGSSAKGEVILDNTRPTLSVSVLPVPAQGADSLHGEVYQQEIVITPTYYDNVGVKTIIFEITNERLDTTNYITIEPPPGGIFQKPIEILPGLNTIVVKAFDFVLAMDADTIELTYVSPDTSVVVCAEGDTIIAPDGTTLIIPPDALLRCTKITISPVPDDELSPCHNSELKMLKIAHDFTPDGLQFHKPVTMILPYTDFELDPDRDGTPNYPEDSLSVFFYDGLEWIKVEEPERNAIDNRLEVSINHFTIFDIGVDRRKLPEKASVFWTRNPFKPREGTTICFTLPEPGLVTVKVYDLAGDVVATVTKEQPFKGGTNSLKWDGKSDFGRFVGSGIYVYVLKYESDSHKNDELIKKPIGVIK